jgi:hypothetical protein
MGWLHKANVDESNNRAILIAARELATLLLNKDCCIYTQHFKGAFNNVADALSCNHNLTEP